MRFLFSSAFFSLLFSASSTIHANDIIVEERLLSNPPSEKSPANAASEIAKAGSLIQMVKAETLPCDGCFFAVFDKVKKDYHLNYITPNTPNMKEIVQKKQEVIWVNAKGDYSPYWSEKDDKGRATGDSFTLLCFTGLLGSGSGQEYNACQSGFWSNTFIKDTVKSLGVGPAIQNAFVLGLSLGTTVSYNKAINPDQVNTAKAVLDASDINVCGSSLTDKISVSDSKKLTVQDLQSSNISTTYTYIYTKDNVKNCLHTKDYIFATSTSKDKYYFISTHNQTSLIATINGQNNVLLAEHNTGGTFRNIDCSLGKENKYKYIDDFNESFFSVLKNNDNLIFSDGESSNCIDLKNYEFKPRTLMATKEVFLFSKNSDQVIVFSKPNNDLVVKKIDLASLDNKDLFDFYYHLDPNFLSEKLIVIPYQTTLATKKRKSLSNLNRSITKEVQQYVSVPLVPEPSLPPTPTLVKGEFEKEGQFKERVLLEMNKREEKVKELQAQYRIDVEKRNKEVEKRIELKDKYTDFITQQYFKQMMGGVHLQNANYDPDKEIMYVDMVSTNSDFTRQLAIPVPLANNEAQQLKQEIESSESLDVKALFLVDKSNIVLNEVQLTSNGKPYLTNIQADKFLPQTVEFTLPQTQAQLDAIYQNPNLADLIQIPKLSFADRAFNGNVQFIDDVADGVKQLSASPTDTKKWLFLVAVEDYKETDKVVFAKHSAELLATTLKKRLGISDRKAYLLIDADATAGAIKDKLAQMITNIQPDDTIYFYYSGHGVPDPVSAESYILPRDKVVDFVVKEPEFQLGNIYRMLSQSAAGKVIAFVDSCFSGRTDNISIIKGTAPGLIRVKEMDIQGQNMAVITAGKNTQFSNAYDAKGHRMFSYFLIRSLLKERNAPLDINTIFQEVSVGVRDESNAKGDIYKQEPQVYGNSSLPL